jgi:murein DD-endopeptidase MepM/ murein hydrolase activator NlpD
MLARLGWVAAFAFSITTLAGCGGAEPPPQTPPPRQFPAQPPAPPPLGSPGLGPNGALLYRWPFVGAWKVQRTHYPGNQADQAWAIDLFAVDPAGSPTIGRGSRNDQWVTYRAPIVADAPGEVVIVVDGNPENIVGKPNGYDMHGNFVVIDHKNGEFSLFAHLIPGSIEVRVGQQVTYGNMIGHCGNSGHSTNPHLHWQVMTAANATYARAVQPRLAPYLRNGAPSTEMPATGEMIQNQ